MPLLRCACNLTLTVLCSHCTQTYCIYIEPTKASKLPTFEMLCTFDTWKNRQNFENFQKCASLQLSLGLRHVDKIKQTERRGCIMKPAISLQGYTGGLLGCQPSSQRRRATVARSGSRRTGKCIKKPVMMKSHVRFAKAADHLKETLSTLLAASILVQLNKQLSAS